VCYTIPSKGEHRATPDRREHTVKNVMKKLHNRKGESLAETLVAVLVIALALTMLAGMITATANMVNKSKSKMNEYYTENARLEQMTVDGTLNMKLTGDVSVDVTVSQTTNNTFSNKPVIAYEIG